jgi:hypothetical protein
MVQKPLHFSTQCNDVFLVILSINIHCFHLKNVFFILDRQAPSRRSARPVSLRGFGGLAVTMLASGTQHSGCKVQVLNRARNSRCTVITDLGTSKRSTQKGKCCAFVGLDNKLYKMYGAYIEIKTLLLTCKCYAWTIM